MPKVTSSERASGKEDRPPNDGLAGKVLVLLRISEAKIAFRQSAILGKVALVTGSSRSMGASIAKALAEQGVNVVVNYGHDPNPAAEVIREIKSLGKGDAIAVKADAATIEGGKVLLEETMQVFGRLDILILNAGIMGSKVLQDVDEAFFDAHFNANVKGPLFLVKEAARILPTRKYAGHCIPRLMKLTRHVRTAGGRVVFFSTSLTTATCKRILPISRFPLQSAERRCIAAVLPNALCYVASKGRIRGRVAWAVILILW